MLKERLEDYGTTISLNIGTFVILNMLGWIFAILLLVMLSENAFGTEYYNAQTNVRNQHAMYILQEVSPQSTFVYEITNTRGQEVTLDPDCGNYTRDGDYPREIPAIIIWNVSGGK